MAKLSPVSPVKPLTKKQINRRKKNKAKRKKAAQNEKPNNDANVEPKTDIETESIDDKQTDKVEQNPVSDELAEKYPVFKNQDLVNKVLGITITNNQKGRIRQQLQYTLKGTSEEILPEVIYNRIQAIVKDNVNLTDAELRKIRILYNMLKTSIKTDTGKVQKKKKKNKRNKKPKEKKENGSTEAMEKDNSEATEKDTALEKDSKDSKDVKKEKESKKTKGPKRYVVFVGNLPLDIDKEKLTHHFYEIREHILDVRIQKPAEGKKSCIAYLELKNEPSFELALSKHHTMMDNRRINVLYTMQQNSKISKTEAKSKSAKLIALQKSGKLMGSVPLHKKRSHRRMIAKKARAKLEAES